MDISKLKHVGELKKNYLVQHSWRNVIDWGSLNRANKLVRIELSCYCAICMV